MTLRCLILYTIGFLLLVTPLYAQNDDTLREFESALKEQQAVFEKLDTQFQEDDTDDDALFATRQKVLDIRSMARQANAEIAPRRLILSEALKDIGPPPVESEPGEPENISKQRESLRQQLSRLDGLLKESEVHINQATRYLERIASARRSLFFENLFTRETPPLNTEFWWAAARSFIVSRADLFGSFDVWIDTRPGGRKISTMLAVAALIFAVSVFVIIWLYRGAARMIAQRAAGQKSSRGSRKLSFCLMILAANLPVLILGGIVYGVLRLAEILTGEATYAAMTLWASTVFIMYVVTWGRQLFASDESSWSPLSPQFRKTSLPPIIMTLIAVLFAIDSILLQLTGTFMVAVEVTFAQSVISTLLLSVLLGVFAWLAVPSRKSTTDIASLSRMHIVATLRWCTLGLATIAILASLFGYISLGRYLIERSILLITILSVLWIFRTLLREGIFYLDTVLGKGRASLHSAEEEGQDRFFRYWSSLILDLILIVISAPVILLIIGVEWSQFDDWIIRIVNGIQIGSITISIVNLIQAITLFILLLMLTRLAQGVIEKRLIPKTHMDKGAANSLVTLVGYVGFLTAVVAAISALGLDFSNVALIAGALSVGIGFGLQSIVNNFVSGLILLFERPVKVGDWVVLASGEGFVKRISVRSTEIQTFDHASIIVPNSELISSSVINWTLTDRQGRIIISVGVSYKSDPEEVRDILLRCAEAHPRLAKYPAPMVYFKEFGNSSLDFELRVFLKEVSDWIKVGSELRFTIFKAFREAGVEIPFPQRDVHIKEPVKSSAPQ